MIRKIVLCLFLACASFNIQADTYVDLAMEYHDKTKDSFYQRNGEVIQNAIGVVEVGYEFKEQYSIYFRHQSSVQQKDTGLNVVGVKVRIW